MTLFATMQYSEYSNILQEGCDVAYQIAEQARKVGHDPKNFVEIPQAHDLADRTQKLLNFLDGRNTAQQIRDLSKSLDGNRELVAIEIANIVSAESYLYSQINPCVDCNGKGFKLMGEWKKDDCVTCSGKGYSLTFEGLLNKKTDEILKEFDEIDKFDDESRLAMSIYHGVCAGLAVLTEGILVAPLEGVVSSRIVINEDSTKAICVNYAGPIRSAGGTGQALSVLIADILRRRFKLSKSKLTYGEIERYKEEVSFYGRGLQYRPSNHQIEILTKNCPVYIDGEGVGNEVTGQRDLPRVPTNKSREGAILVICEGLVLKAPKILKYTNALGLEGWDWLTEFVQDSNDDLEEIKPNEKFVADILAGRPIFGLPMATGSFRLRYGRSRLGGLATTSIHPATMKALDGFAIIGTQLKYERPGKATVVTPCTDIDGPYIQFKDGSARRINAMNELPEGSSTDVNWPIEKVWDLGDILIPVGEFIENNHPLIASPYVKEWHSQLVYRENLEYPKSFSEACEQSKNNQLPMCPEFVAHFNDISPDELLEVYRNLYPSVCGSYILINDSILELIYRLNIDVIKSNGRYILDGDNASTLINTLMDGKKYKGDLSKFSNGLDLINDICDYEIKPKVTYRIGARMGKPEGSKLREMKPAIHVMFPLGFNIGAQRKVEDALLHNDSIDIGIRYDEINEVETFQGVVEGHNTKFLRVEKVSVPLLKLLNDAKKITGCYKRLPLKGVKGLTSAEKLPENLAKGILRYQNDISVFRDGTIRFDMVDITMTHFKPSEIGLSVSKAKQLGYDVNDENEVVELYPQDIVIPKNCVDKLIKTTKYLDGLLDKLYGLEPFYNCETQEDLIGHLMMGLAPHTSGAILCRIVGVADIKGHYGHPFFHASKRRNCDGDIDSVLFLLDGLINFSRSYLATTRGGQMDAPLILTTKINPAEIDKEALNIDINTEYPVEFYEITQNLIASKEALNYGIRTVETVLGTEEQYRGFGYTHETDDCSEGPKNNPYNTLESMKQKTNAQFALGEVLHSVDNKIQSSKLIDRHLIRDMRGNLRAFGQQKVRCTKCATSYRRPPITGNCNTVIDSKTDPFTKREVDVVCPGNLILTVSKGSINKYGGLIKELVERYGCDRYTEELQRLARDWVNQTFYDKDEKLQQTLW
jgi:DNA polymerase II large subunit